jgi:hypothetical protein
MHDGEKCVDMGGHGNEYAMDGDALDLVHGGSGREARQTHGRARHVSKFRVMLTFELCVATPMELLRSMAREVKSQ